MKISKFQLLDQEADELFQILKQFNQTETDYPREQTIHALFDEVAAAQPEKIAVVSENQEEISYGALKQQSDQLARFLTQQGVKAEDPITVLLEPSVSMLVALLGILKAGGAYVALSMDFPFERLKFIVNDTRSRLLISEKKFIKTLNSLQWECPELQQFICLDSEQPREEEERLNELMKKELWDYVGEEANDDISGGGWVNSYTGENLSRAVMDEYGDNILKKLAPLLKKDFRVLEIGCSSGISMFRLAPLVAEYYGTDLSDEILKKTEAERKRLGLDHVHLFALPAHEIHQLEARDFDVIIINSVLQCFNGHNYLRSVLAKALQLLNNQGIIFIGDVMDQDRKEELVSSLLLFKKENLGKGYTTKVDWSNELFLSRRFLDDLRHDFPAIVAVEHSEKIAVHRSELSDFRFDSVLTVRKTSAESGLAAGPRHKYQWGTDDLAKTAGANLPASVGARSLAYITFTSGTSGNPKGVLIEHRSVVRLVKQTNYIAIQPEDTIVQTAPLSFDASTFEIWGALLNGATLYTLQKDTLLDFEAFEKVLKEQKVTIGWFTSPLFNQLVELAPQLFRHYKTLLVGGDVVSPNHVRKAQLVNPALVIINGYGPTENTTFSTCYRIEGEVGAMIPIGKPVSNSRCYIVKENNPDQVVPVGIVGELCVAGDGLARGYLNDSVLTDAKFFPHSKLAEPRLYRTGDRAKWLPDGNIAFMGRVDEQVKIRGYRIEIKEIESKLAELPGVKEAAVVIHEDPLGDKQLAAYLAVQEAVTVEDLKASLTLSLPSYMIPTHFVLLEQLPLNDNGKVDKKYLPALIQNKAEEEWCAPRNPTEEKLAAIWKTILGLNQISIHDNFFQIGGHSLKATQVISSVLEKLKVKISIREMFTYPTIAGMSELISRLESSQLVRIEPIANQPYYEMSQAQKRVWIMSQFDKNQIAYNMPGLYALTGINKETFDRTLQTVVERYEVLRTTFNTVSGEPKQVVHQPGEYGFAVVHLDLRGEENRKERLTQLAQAEAMAPFDLEKGPLFRATLVQLEEQEFVFLYTLHHIISDGWSMKVLVNDVIALYEAYSQGLKNPLSPLRIQYKDYSAWQDQELSGKELEGHRNFWLHYLSEPLPALELPTDFPRPKLRSFKGELLEFALAEDLSKGIHELCKKNEATLFMTFVAAVQVALHKYANQTDIRIGTPVSGRIHKDLENQIGFFVNLVVVRSQIDPEQTFSDYLLLTKQNVLQAFEHQVYPFDALVKDLGISKDASRSPLFEVEVTTDVVDAFVPSTTQPASQMQDEVMVEEVEMELNIGSKFDLTLKLIERVPQMKLQITYNSDLFRRRSILLLKERLVVLLEDILENPGKKLADLNFKTQHEQPKELIKIDPEFNF